MEIFNPRIHKLHRVDIISLNVVRLRPLDRSEVNINILKRTARRRYNNVVNENIFCNEVCIHLYTKVLVVNKCIVGNDKTTQIDRGIVRQDHTARHTIAYNVVVDVTSPTTARENPEAITIVDNVIVSL